MKRILLLFLSVGFCLVFAEAEENVSERFFKANQRYAEGNYQEAVRLYEEMVQSGIASGPLYYNLGNAYFKTGRIGKSLLNYERARRYLPQDEDLLANLLFVASLREQEQPKESYLWFEWFALTLRDLFSAHLWMTFCVIFFNLFFGVLILAIFHESMKKHLFPFAWLLVFLAVFSFGFGSAKRMATEKMREGIVVQRMAEVRYSPSSDGVIAFQLKEGIQVQILRCDGKWCHIRLTRDKSGWVDSSTIEAI